MINNRIEELICYFSNGNKSLFSKQIEVTPSVIGNITGERKGNPSFEVVSKIIDAFAEVDANWLITGQGEMLKKNSDSVVLSNQSEHEKDSIIAYLEQVIEKKEAKIEAKTLEIGALKSELSKMKEECNKMLFKTENIDQPSLFKSPDVTSAHALSKKTSKADKKQQQDTNT